MSSARRCPYHIIKQTLGVVGIVLSALVCQGDGKDFPVNRPTNDISETGKQMMGRDGPRMSNKAYTDAILAVSAPWDVATQGYDGSTTTASREAGGSFIILTLANDAGMQHFVPQLLSSLQQQTHPGKDGQLQPLTAFTAVIAASHVANTLCWRMVKKERFNTTCISDPISGLHDGIVEHPSYKSLSFGFMKLKHIINTLAVVDVLWLDADVVALQNPIPLLAKLDADIAVGVSACGSQWPTVADAGSHAAGDPIHDSSQGDEHGDRKDSSQDVEANGDSRRKLHVEQASLALPPGTYTTGMALYRTCAPVMRCLYSLSIDMWRQTKITERVWEQERFGAVVLQCAAQLHVRMEALPPLQFPTLCGEQLTEGEAQQEAVLVHAAHDGHFMERQQAVEELMKRAQQSRRN